MHDEWPCRLLRAIYRNYSVFVLVMRMGKESLIFYQSHVIKRKKAI